MATLPILVFPTRETSDRSNRPSGPNKVHYPVAQRQAARIWPQLQNIQATFESRRAHLRTEVAGIEPEMVLVLETIGTIDEFIRAVRLIPGMEWMAEMEEDSAEPDEDFFDEKTPEKPIGARLFLIFTNQTALTELLRLWNAYQEQPDAKFPYGFGRWKSLFKQLRTIRIWSVEDRLRETGLLESWREDVEHGETLMRFEAELWFREDETSRAAATRELRTLIQEQGGEVVTQAVIPEIAYHAVIGQIPAAAAPLVRDQAEGVRLFQCEQVMFFRPIGQFSTPPATDEPGPEIAPVPNAAASAPIVALLDGLPMENHAVLSGRLLIDDPDDWGADYPAAERQHGTAMASLIAHGDLSGNAQPLDTLIYVRPIMRPDPHDFRNPRGETIPRDVIPADLMHRAVRRMFEASGQENPIAPSVRVVNLSIGDTARQYHRIVSPFARIVDFLAWRYRVLFIVSAGNQANSFRIGTTPEQWATLNPEERAAHVVRAVASSAHIRRLLSPAEAINCLTVGSAHTDQGPGATEAHRIDPYGPGFPSPVNAIGSGFRRSVKPDLLCDGGRQVYSVQANEPGTITLVPDRFQGRPPGQRTASPGLAGDLNRTNYTRGTSNAAATATRHAAAISMMLDGLTTPLDRYLIPVATKCLVAHSSSWTSATEQFAPIIEQLLPDGNMREQLSRFFGYGTVQVDRVLGCAPFRVTIIGAANITDGEGHSYVVPLPPSLSGIVGRRRLTATLTWFSPINPAHRNYRKAAIWFEAPSTSDLQLARLECDHRAVQRGTLQHEIFEGERAIAFVDGANIRLKVNCRADAGSLDDQVPYALAVTLEVAEDLAVPIYDEVRVRLALPVPITPTPAV